MVYKEHRRGVHQTISRANEETSYTKSRVYILFYHKAVHIFEIDIGYYQPSEEMIILLHSSIWYRFTANISWCPHFFLDIIRQNPHPLELDSPLAMVFFLAALAHEVEQRKLLIVSTFSNILVANQT